MIGELSICLFMVIFFVFLVMITSEPRDRPHRKMKEVIASSVIGGMAGFGVYGGLFTPLVPNGILTWGIGVAAIVYGLCTAVFDRLARS